MKILKYGFLLLWVFLIQFSMAKEYTKKDYIEVAEKYIEEKYNASINCSYRVVIDSSVYVYISELGAGDIPIQYLESLILINKETLEVIHANLRLKMEVYERVTNEKPLSLEEIPEFLNQLTYEGEYEIDTKSVEVTPKENHKNHYDIENIPFLLDEKDNKTTIEVEKVYEPITKNNSGNVYELTYYINYMDVHHNAYTVILFAYTKTVKKIIKGGY